MNTRDPGLGVTLDDVRAAAARIGPFIRRTPVLTSRYFDERIGARLFFKCENFQRVGAFKFRGATNAVRLLTADQAQRVVVTHSSGNHAQALAAAARARNIRATIVMPRNAPAVKRDAVAGYGATIVECEPTLAARESTTDEIIARTGATLVHPYDNHHIIAGQGTAALELLEDAGPLDFVVAPVGGGGLLAGTALVTTELVRGVQVWGAEPSGADDAHRSLAAGRVIPSENPDTIADGLLTSLGERNFRILSERVTQIATVDDEQTIQAMRLVFERMKIVIEPSAAVAVAVVLDRAQQLAGSRVGIILSGGNVDVARLPWMADKGAKD